MKYDDSITMNLAKCLTLQFQPKRKTDLEQLFSRPGFSWESWIKTASDQFVLPAIYLQMERAGLLSAMPPEWLEHLAELVEKNSKRNRRIMEEVQVISKRLIGKGIEPVFLKGTAHLLLNLYTHPAERMIGDIDFLVKEPDIFPAVKVLEDLGFKPLVNYNVHIHKEMKHFPRMVNYDYEAAVEAHRQVVLAPYNNSFSAQEILNDKQEVQGMPGVFVPSNRHLIVHNILNAQFNDKAYQNRLLLLRQKYDLLLLSKRENPKSALSQFNAYPKQVNTYLALCAHLFDLPEQIDYEDSTHVKKYLKGFIWYQNHPRTLSLYRTANYLLSRFWRYISLPVQAVFNKTARAGLWARISDLKWYGKHIQSYSRFFKQ